MGGKTVNSSITLTRQRGFTTGCVLIGLIFFTSIGYLGFKLGGPYIEYRMLAGAMDGVAKHEDFATLNSGRILGRIKESVRRSSGVSPSTLDVKKISYVVVRDGRKVVGVNYEVVVELGYNISALLHFKHESFSKPSS